jgi:hypothetical protein
MALLLRQITKTQTVPPLPNQGYSNGPAPNNGGFNGPSPWYNNGPWNNHGNHGPNIGPYQGNGGGYNSTGYFQNHRDDWQGYQGHGNYQGQGCSFNRGYGHFSGQAPGFNKGYGQYSGQAPGFNYGYDHHPQGQNQGQYQGHGPQGQHQGYSPPQGQHQGYGHPPQGQNQGYGPPHGHAYGFNQGQGFPCQSHGRAPAASQQAPVPTSEVADAILARLAGPIAVILEKSVAKASNMRSGNPPES